MSANQSERPARGRIAEIADEKRRWEKVTKKKSVQRNHGDCYTPGYQGQIHNMVLTTEPHQMKTKLGVVFVVRLKSLSPRRKIFLFCQRVETAFVLNSSPSIVPPQKLFAHLMSYCMNSSAHFCLLYRGNLPRSPSSASRSVE